MRLPRLSSRLVLLAVASMAPVLVLCLLLAWFLVEREATLVQEGTTDWSRAIAAAVDAQLDGHLSALRALAASQGLEQGDLVCFAAAAQRVKAIEPYWRNVLLVDGTGHQRMNLRFPPGASLPDEPEAEQTAMQQVLASGQARFGDVGRGPVSGSPGVPVRLRVQAAGEPMVLMAVVDPRAFESLLAGQRLPSTWVSALIDRNGRFVARLPPRPPGSLAAPGLREAISQAETGWSRVATLEGTDAYQAFVRTAQSHWTVAVAIPATEVSASARRAMGWLVPGALVSLALAAALAVLISRRVAAPIHALAQAAREVGNNDVAALQAVQQRPGFSEVLEVAHALEEAAQAIQDRESLQAREQLALRDAERAKDEFLAMLGHELRNPLSAITTAAQVLRTSMPSAHATQRAHQVIERQAQQMTRMVEDLLDISRLVTGKLRLETEPADLMLVVQRAVHAWQQQAARRDASVSFHGVSAWACVDRVRLEQIVVNLLENAYKFSPKDHAIEVTVRAEGSQALLEVRDHGQGIAAKDLPLIFQTFYQAEQLMHRPQGGLGLGLSLVKRLAELHGGDVRAVSAGDGLGATLTVTLPRIDPATSTQSDAMAPAQTTGRRILLVEDNEDGRTMLALMLELDGHDVRAAAGGREALQIASNWLPDVALIDLGLPDLGGRDVARQMLQMGLTPPPRLIAVSGFGQPEDRAQSLQAGFEQHITKPVDPQVLLRLISAPAARHVS